jgi:hypothetical protein
LRHAVIACQADSGIKAMPFLLESNAGWSRGLACSVAAPVEITTPFGETTTLPLIFVHTDANIVHGWSPLSTRR